MPRAERIATADPVLHRRDQPRRSSRRRRSLSTLAAACLVTAACGSRPEIALPNVHGPAGQLPAGYQLEVTRGVLLARIEVVTDGQPGFGPITNPLVLKLQPADAADEVLDPLSANARVWTTNAERPSQWRDQPPGLLAMSVVATTYGGLLIAYPDFSHDRATASSIPEPSAALAFAPIEIPAGEIVYIGDIEIRQTVSAWDRLLDRVEVAYAVRDDCDRTVADFRARYPQLADTAVQRRVAQIVERD